MQTRQAHRAARLIPAAILTAMVLVLGACESNTYTHGNRLEPEALARVVPGQTRIAEVEALFGKPSVRGAFNSGTVYYISQYMETRPGGRKQTITREIIAFSYDADGVVTAVDITDESAGRNVAVNDAATPVPGNTFGVVDQVLSNVKRRRNTAPRQ